LAHNSDTDFRIDRSWIWIRGRSLDGNVLNGKDFARSRTSKRRHNTCLDT
jgi:hypothetical protein